MTINKKDYLQCLLWLCNVTKCDKSSKTVKTVMRDLSGQHWQIYITPKSVKNDWWMICHVSFDRSVKTDRISRRKTYPPIHLSVRLAYLGEFWQSAQPALLFLRRKKNHSSLPPTNHTLAVLSGVSTWTASSFIACSSSFLANQLPL